MNVTTCKRISTENIENVGKWRERENQLRQLKEDDCLFIQQALYIELDDFLVDLCFYSYWSSAASTVVHSL